MKRELSLRDRVKPLIRDETDSARSSLRKTETRRGRMVEALAIGQGLVIVSLLSWILTGFQTVPAIRAWAMNSLIMVGLISISPFVIPLWTGLVIGAGTVYVVDRRVKREERIIQYLLELIE